MFGLGKSTNVCGFCMPNGTGSLSYIGIITTSHRHPLMLDFPSNPEWHWELGEKCQRTHLNFCCCCCCCHVKWRGRAYLRPLRPCLWVCPQFDCHVAQSRPAVAVTAAAAVAVAVAVAVQRFCVVGRVQGQFAVCNSIGYGSGCGLDHLGPAIGCPSSAPLNELGAKRCENKKHLTHQQSAADSIRQTPSRANWKGVVLMDEYSFDGEVARLQLMPADNGLWLGKR